MRLSIILLISLLVINELYSQEINGKVIDATNSELLPYTSIGIVNTSIGTITNDDGEFNLNVEGQKPSSVIRFSMLGYEAQTFLIKELSGKKNIIKLNPSVIQLEEVTVKPNTETRIIGITKRTKGWVCGWGGNRRGKGHEIGSKFDLGDSFTKLQNLHIRVLKQSYDSTLFRLHIRNIKDGLPHEELINENIYFTIDKSSGWVEIDLKEYDIVLKNEIALTVEWIKVMGLNKKNLVRVNKSKQKTANVLFSVKKNSGCLYIKRGIEGKWMKIDTQSPSIYLTVQ